eukprot:1267835-Pyramimonas_sp.AAC.1
MPRGRATERANGRAAGRAKGLTARRARGTRHGTRHETCQVATLSVSILMYRAEGCAVRRRAELRCAMPR